MQRACVGDRLLLAQLHVETLEVLLVRGAVVRESFHCEVQVVVSALHTVNRLQVSLEVRHDHTTNKTQKTTEAVEQEMTKSTRILELPHGSRQSESIAVAVSHDNTITKTDQET